MTLLANATNAKITTIKDHMETAFDVMKHVVNVKEIQIIASHVVLVIISMEKNVNHVIQIAKNALEHEIFAPNVMMVNT